MELQVKAREIGQRPELAARDLAWEYPGTADKRVSIVCAHVAEIFQTKAGASLAPAQVANHPLSGDDSFSSSNPADVALLIFEVIAERNCNAQLWDVRGVAGIDAEIQNTVRKYLLGPAPFVGSVSEGVHESTYSGAKDKLIRILDTKLPF